MLERLYMWLMEKPERLEGWGWVLFHTGAGMLMAAAISRIFMIAAAFGPKPPERVADLGLPFPTFFVPESFFGFLLAAVLVVTGLVALYTARKYKRIYWS